VRLTVRTLALGAGGVLIALGLSNVIFAVAARKPLGPYLVGALPFLLIALGLVWWARTRRAASVPTQPPSVFWTVVALVVGALLVGYGLLNGLIVSIIFSPSDAIASALIPWGILGGVLVAYGAYRLVRAGALQGGARQGEAVLEGIVGPLPTPYAANSPGELETLRLVALHRELVETVGRTYRATAPAIRAWLWSWFGLWLVAVASVAILIAPTLGVSWQAPGAGPPATVPIPIAVAILAAVALGVVEVGIGVQVRLRDLRRAGPLLAVGRVPDSWMLAWGWPFTYIARLLRGFGPVRSERTEPDSEASDLATSFALLQFGRRLAGYARFWYTTVFLLLLILGSFSAFVIVSVVAIVGFHGSVIAPYGAFLAFGSVLAVVLGAFGYLYHRYRVLDPIVERLGRLEEAELALERAFWSRF